MWKLVLLSHLCALLLTSAHLSCEEPKQEVVSFFEEYQKAFDKHDTDSMANMWAKDGHRIHPRTGEEVVGRDQIREGLKKLFADEKADKLQVRLLKTTPPENGEVEAIGRFRISYSDNTPPHESAFKVFLVQEEGKWKIDEVREIGADAPDSHAKHLKELEFLIGSWEDADEDVTIKNKAKFDRNQNFILQKYTIESYGTQLMMGYQIIGWDPIAKTIRAWMFDTDGGFGEGTWKKKEDKWYVDTHFTLNDGTKASAVYIYTPIDKDSYSWASVDRDAGGEALPNIEPVTIKRIAKED